MTQTYPIILRPSEGATAIRPFVKHGKTKKKGPSELIAFSRLHRLGLKELRSDISVKIAGYNYEPDIVYINNEKGVFIDIEVDEPYSAYDHPTHCIDDRNEGKDDRCNEIFQNAGWYVIRFTEEQLFCHTKACTRDIYKTLMSAGVVVAMPSNIVGTEELPVTSRWTERQSWTWIRQQYRNTYLGFSPKMNKFSDYIRCVRLVIPIILQSITDKPVRKELKKQLKRFFSIGS